ncbi:nucleotidyl transferase AbiEii/AbiGii toxin family protein [Demequina lutea]|uniref:Nucleotidyl transferase AbiEii toxin, Type IV TA system n=1 Tax=Demequina lutea TaxID=431489 RepID=A0A7Z0CH49_9MICO|nr:nucleotidyl transferase AbiEii/AbiGii toxin family protein [Demequina lutea]NYI41131.1 hypothetical protein [Demequina lutea]
MSPRLREDADSLNALVAQTARARGLDPAYVEKDFWVTEVLRAAAIERTIDGASEATRVVFKGGTSLSRVFGLIERFSEDIDLLVVFPEGPSAKARHKIFRKIDADVCSWLGTESKSPDSSTGIHRTTTYVYPASYGSSAIKEVVVLELGSRGGEIPASEHQYRSMVAIYAEETYGDDESVWEEFASFPVTVLAPQRTLLEKLAAVHAAVTNNDQQAIFQFGRHFYDIGRLLKSEQVQGALALLGPDGVASLTDDINDRSQAAGWKWVPRPDGGFADSPAFDDQHEAHAIVQRGYTAALELVHGVAPSLAEVVDTVRASRAIL